MRASFGIWDHLWSSMGIITLQCKDYLKSRDYLHTPTDWFCIDLTIFKKRKKLTILPFLGENGEASTCAITTATAETPISTVLTNAAFLKLAILQKKIEQLVWSIVQTCYLFLIEISVICSFSNVLEKRLWQSFLHHSHCPVFLNIRDFADFLAIGCSMATWWDGISYM